MKPSEQAEAVKLLQEWIDTYDKGAEVRAALAAKTVKFIWFGKEATT